MCRGESEEFVRAFDFLQSYLNELVLKPPGYALLSRYLTKEGREYGRALKVLNTYVRTMVREAQAKAERMQEGGEGSSGEEEEEEDRGAIDGTRGGSDLLSLFLARGEQRRGSREEEESYLRDVVVNMTIAGRDTTAYALAWALHLLSLHPHIQDTAAQEAIAAGASNLDVPMDSASIDTCLPYLDAIWTEVLRLYPSVPKNPKMALVDDILPDGTPIPQGAYVMYAPWVMGRLTQLWGHSAEAFDPERHLLRQPSSSPFSSFSDGPVEGEGASGKGPILRSTRPSAMLWPAFQAGPRTCLGQRLAYMEAKALLARLLATFR